MVMDVVRETPAETSFGQIVDRLSLLAAVREGLEQSERGAGVPAEEVRERVRAWAA